MGPKFFESLKNHQITGKGIVGFGLPVTLTDSDNQYLSYPIRGVIVILEQGTDLSIIKAVFHVRDPASDSLGPPVSVGHPRFEFQPERCPRCGSRGGQ